MRLCDKNNKRDPWRSQCVEVGGDRRDVLFTGASLGATTAQLSCTLLHNPNQLGPNLLQLLICLQINYKKNGIHNNISISFCSFVHATYLCHRGLVKYSVTVYVAQIKNKSSHNPGKRNIHDES